MPHWYLSRPFWLYWTVAGRGARDGRINHPKEGIAQQMRPEIGQLDLVAAFLREIEIKLAVLSGGDTPASTRLQVDSSDYDGAVRALESIMHSRHLPLDALPADARRELVKIMVYLVDQHAKGKKEEPALLTHYEAELIKIAEEKIEDLRKDWELKRNAIKTKAEQEQHKLEKAATDFNELDKLHAQKQYKQPYPLIGKWLYMAILLGLAAGEYWINMLAFAVAFPKGSPELYVSALIPAIAIPVFAHVIGTQIRYWQGKREANIKIRWQSVTIVIGSLLFAILAGSALLWLRSSYIMVTEGADAIRWQDAISIFLLNMAGVWAGIAAAYIAHDVDSDLESICKSKKQLLKDMHIIWTRRTKLATEFDTLRGVCISDVGKVREDTVAKIMEYRDYNARFRADGSVPSVFMSEVGHRFFEVRDFSHELSLAPPPLLHLYGSKVEGPPPIGADDRASRATEQPSPPQIGSDGRSRGLEASPVIDVAPSAPAMRPEDQASRPSP